MPIFRLSDDLVFPPPFLAEPGGLLAVGGDLSVERLLLAYSMGIFPWYSEGDPVLWWSPDPRLLFFADTFHVTRRLARTLRQGRFAITLDSAFDEVVTACAAAWRPGQAGTWITDDMKTAYGALHRAGYAHSIECWRDGVLVGGMYGVSLGRCYFGESMFSRERDASKVALARMMDLLRAWGFAFLDAQMPTPHLLSLGGMTIPRREFLARLRDALRAPAKMGKWS